MSCTITKPKKIQSIPEAFVWSGELLLTEVTRLMLETKKKKKTSVKAVFREKGKEGTTVVDSNSRGRREVPGKASALSI